MSTKRPWQIYTLVAGYLIGILYIANFVYYNLGQRKSLIYYTIIGIINLVFIAQIAILAIRHKWAYYMSLVLLIPIGISLAINMLFIFSMPNIWLIIIPLSGLMTVYSLLCSATRNYFGVK